MSLFQSLGIPKGPSFSKALPHMLRLSGTQVNFRSPPHTSRVRPFKPLPTTYSLSDIKPSTGGEDEISEPAIGYLPFIGCFEQEWSYRGLPIIQPDMGRLTLSVRAVQADAYGTLFNPENLRQAYAETVRQTYGPTAGAEFKGSGEPASCDYQIINDACWFGATSSGREEGSQRSDWCIAIASIHFLIVSFEKKSPRCSASFEKACDRLIDKIMGTFRIEFSAEAKRQQRDAREQMPVEPFLASSSGLIRDGQASEQYKQDDGILFQNGAEYKAKIVPIKRRHM